jgi:hypothetical protein
MSVRVEVQFTVYEPGTGNIRAEGTDTIPGSTNCWLAEQTVRAKYNGLEVCIRSSTPFYN